MIFNSVFVLWVLLAWLSGRTYDWAIVCFLLACGISKSVRLKNDVYGTSRTDNERFLFEIVASVIPASIVLFRAVELTLALLA